MKKAEAAPGRKPEAIKARLAEQITALLEACLGLCLPTAIDRAWFRLERDMRLRAEMDYCGPVGLPHSTFLGAGIGMWSEQDRELALAWQQRKQATCGRCGTRHDQWLTADGRLDPQAFEAVAEECPGDYALHVARKALKDDQGDYVHVFLVPATDDDDGGAV